VLNLALLGVQGSGKGTQAGLLEKKYEIELLSVGNLLRTEMKNKSDFGKEIRHYMKAGKLVPDKFVFEVIDDHLHKELKGIVLDGFPRNLNQACFLEEQIDLNYAIYFALDDETAVNRLSSRRVCEDCHENYNLLLKPPKNEGKCDKCAGKLITREDDNKDAIIQRLTMFHQQTKPVVDFYEARSKLITLDASEKPQIIHEKLLDKLGID
jgi:adenylate kinase